MQRSWSQPFIRSTKSPRSTSTSSSARCRGPPLSVPEVSAAKIPTEAVEAMNDLGRHRGHNPYECMFGHTPEMDTASLKNDGENAPLMHKLPEGHSDDPFTRNMKIRILARQRLLEDGACQKLAHLLDSCGRQETECSVGNVVFCWSKVRPDKKTKNVGRPEA